MLLIAAACTRGAGEPADPTGGPGSGTVVGADGTVRVRGVLTAEGAECPALRGLDGKLYTLTPRDLGAHRQGDTVTVTGTAAEISTCMQGTTIAVTRIDKAP